jgi:hypothetical protein
MYWIDLAQGGDRLRDLCEHGNDTSVSTRRLEILQQFTTGGPSGRAQPH